MKTIRATYEDGVFRPAEHLDLASGTQVELFLKEPADDPAALLRARYPDSFGGRSRDEGEAMMKIIDDEFERIDPDAWK